MLRKYSTVIKKYPNQSFDRIVGPPVDGSGGVKFAALEADGVCAVGEAIEPGQVYINKQTPANTNSTLQDVASVAEAGYKAAPMIYRAPCAGYVDKVRSAATRSARARPSTKIDTHPREGVLGSAARHGQVLLTSNADNQVLIKVLMRSTRRPEIGDKFSRYGPQLLLQLDGGDLPWAPCFFFFFSCQADRARALKGAMAMWLHPAAVTVKRACAASSSTRRTCPSRIRACAPTSS